MKMEQKLIRYLDASPGGVFPRRLNPLRQAVLMPAASRMQCLFTELPVPVPPHTLRCNVFPRSVPAHGAQYGALARLTTVEACSPSHAHALLDVPAIAGRLLYRDFYAQRLYRVHSEVHMIVRHVPDGSAEGTLLARARVSFPSLFLCARSRRLWTSALPDRVVSRLLTVLSFHPSTSCRRTASGRVGSCRP